MFYKWSLSLGTGNQITSITEIILNYAFDKAKDKYSKYRVYIVTERLRISELLFGVSSWVITFKNTEDIYMNAQ